MTKTRKVIGLMPVRNESWIVRTTIPQIKKYCDEILALDGGSTDDTVKLLRDLGVKVEPQVGNEDQYSSWRQYLLEWGRRLGGTHFVWLDADEAFTANFYENFNAALDQLKPGQKLVMDWLCLWKSPFALRNDDSVWAKNYKDFIFCDDGVSKFGTTRLHEGRTPGDNTSENSVRWPRAQGAVLHFQFAAFKRFQAKQAYQRCRELYLKTGPAWEINQKYAITLDEPTARVETLPPSWLQDFTNLEAIENVGYDWFFEAILGYFEKRGIAYYESLEIWQLPELKAQFKKQTNREPVVVRDDSPLAHNLRYVKRFIGKIIPSPLKGWLKARL